jgi:hypothetical protein
VTLAATVTWKQALLAWWSFVWRSTIYGAVGGFVLGAVGGGIAGATGHFDRARVVGKVAGILAGLLLSTLAFKQALQVHAGDLIREQTSADS